MALVICPECGREISDKAVCCIGCGCPMDFIVKEIKEQKESHEQKEKKVEAFKPPHFTKDYILSFVPYEAIYERGKKYYIDDRVKNFQYTIDYSVFEANVIGTNLYNCQITAFGNTVTEYSCSCPFHQNNESFCKHLVSLMFEINALASDNSSKSISDLSNDENKFDPDDMQNDDDEDYINEYDDDEDYINEYDDDEDYINEYDDDEDYIDECNDYLEYLDQGYKECLKELSSYSDNMEQSNETGWFYPDDDEGETNEDGLPFGFQWLEDFLEESL